MNGRCGAWATTTDADLTLRVQLQPSFLLHRRPFRDSSQLLEVLTLEHGRVSLVARGTTRRRRGGPTGALLQPFRPLLLGFSSRGELGTLTTVEAGGEMHAPSGEALFSALYVNELLIRLLHRHEAHPELFRSYAATVEELALAENPAPPLRRFEFALLEDLGYGVELTREPDGRDVDPGLSYRVDPQLGTAAVHEVREGDAGTFRGADLLAIARGELDGGHAAAAKRLARHLLAAHLGPQPLQSRTLFAARRGAAAVPT